MRAVLPDNRKYIVAVSGGVDSMTLLHLLVSQNKNLSSNLIVAHFNHGIRPDSDDDEAFVQNVAQNYGLVFMSGYGHLGPNASEEQARNARYSFLFELMRESNAAAVITAHHHDDVIETVAINIIRGTGWRGMVAMHKNLAILRPLLHSTKQEILEYAHNNRLTWREDSSNNDPVYLRNNLRTKIKNQRNDNLTSKLSNNIDNVLKLSAEIEEIFAKLSQNIEVENKIDRHEYASLPVDLSREMLIHWLRKNGIVGISRIRIMQLDVFLRTARQGKRTNIIHGSDICVDEEYGCISNPLSGNLV